MTQLYVDVSARISSSSNSFIFSNYEYTRIVQVNTYSIYSYHQKGRVIGKFSANNHNWPNLNLISYMGNCFQRNLNSDCRHQNPLLSPNTEYTLHINVHTSTKKIVL